MVTAISARSFAGSYTNDENGVKLYTRRKDIPKEAIDDGIIKKDRLSMGIFALLLVSFVVSVSIIIFVLFLFWDSSIGVALGNIFVLFFSVPICVLSFRKLIKKGYTIKRILILGVLTLVTWVAFLYGELILAAYMLLEWEMVNEYKLMIGAAVMAAVLVVIHGYKSY